MEWVETTGRTLEEAKEAALDQLGVDEVDAEFEILDQPRAGLFGRVRGEARVRARVRPTVPRPKEDRRDRRRRGRAGSDSAPADTAGGVAVAETEGGNGRTRSSAEQPSRGRDAARAGAGPAGSNGEAGDSPEAAAPGSRATTASADVASSARDGESSTSTGAAKRRRRRRGGRSGAAKQAGAGVGANPEEAATAGPASRAQPATGDRRGSGSHEREAYGIEAAAEGGSVDAGGIKQGHSINGRGDTPVEVSLEEQGRVAEDFLKGLLSEFGVQASVKVSTPNDEDVRLDLSGSELGLLIGPKGSTLLALQDLTRTAVHHQTGATNGRILVDVGAYRQKRSEALARFAQEVAAKVKETGSPTALEPMAAPDRKVVHDALTGIEGVSTFSEGEEPRRRVVIAPASASSS